ncbi:hypothetical protein CRM22_008838 [Opisthorchis felineus]|uniref:HTH psq-type domain-containing protein n=1 Tax=Opisthorchis felineus TaxID=147828 RepID=A0A4S2LGB8_OPIFE|nr:hypothetical protein CRM22_008838 [Opisthorchis felineus]TGZ59829.1 hypothetical protein CRM22_008838 [Opisthorchis felineus]
MNPSLKSITQWGQQMWNMCQSQGEQDMPVHEYNKLEYTSVPAIEANQLRTLSINPREHTLETKPYVPHSITKMLNGSSQADRRIQSIDCMPLCDTTHIPTQPVDNCSPKGTPSVGTRTLKAVHEEKTSHSGSYEHNPGTKFNGEKQFQCRTWSAPLSTLGQPNNRQLEMFSRESYTNACTSEAEDQPLDLSLKRSFTQTERGSLAQIINYPAIRNGICPTDPFALEQTKSTVNRDRPYSTPFDFIFRQKYHQALHTLLSATGAPPGYSPLSGLPIRTNISDSSRSFVQLFREQWLKKNVASLVHQKMGRRPGIYRDGPPSESEPTTSKINSTADAATIASATRFAKIKYKYGMSITRDHPPGKPLRRPYTEAELSAAVRAICFGRLGTRRAASVYGIPRSTLRNKICKLNELRRREEERQGGQTILMPDFLQGLLQQMRDRSAAGRTATSPPVARGAFTLDGHERRDSVDHPFSTDEFAQLSRRGPEVQKPALRISVTPNRAASIFQVNCRKNYTSRKPGDVTYAVRPLCSTKSRRLTKIHQELGSTQNPETLHIGGTSPEIKSSEDIVQEETDEEQLKTVQPNTVINLQLRSRLTSSSSGSAFQPIINCKPT